jgi:hypothetical protein
VTLEKYSSKGRKVADDKPFADVRHKPFENTHVHPVNHDPTFKPHCVECKRTGPAASGLDAVDDKRQPASDWFIFHGVQFNLVVLFRLH